MRLLIENVIIPLLLVASLSACAVGSGVVAATHEVQRFEYKQVHMGVQARILLYAPDSTTARSAVRAAFDRIAELDAIMSDYRPDSELMRLVRSAEEGPVPVSADLFEVLEIAQRIARESGGAFDVTVGPLVELWRTARREGRLPPDSALKRAAARAGWEKLLLDADARTVELAASGMRLDLGGIAKGYAADEAIAALRAAGIARALIEFGGDVVVSDPPPGESGWRITVPVTDSAGLTAVTDSAGRELVLANQGVSTSADAHQFVEIGGTRYSHVVDPRTGIGLTSRIAVTVVAPRGVLSDALATALSIMGRDDGMAMIAREHPGVKAYVRYLGEARK